LVTSVAVVAAIRLALRGRAATALSGIRPAGTISPQNRPIASADQTRLRY